MPSRICTMTVPSMCLVVVGLMTLCPALAWAQEQVENTQCETIRNQVPPLRERILATGEGLEDLAARTKETLDCYDGRIDLAWGVWLMQQRVFALNRLQRYTESQDVVDEFFSVYATRADSANMARFYMSSLYLKHIDGKFSEAMESYYQGLPYAHKLPDERYKRYLLNAGAIHLAEGKFEEALTIYREVRETFTRIPSPSDNDLFELYGRSLLGEADASLDFILYNDQSGVDLEHVIEQLAWAASIFTLTESHARAAVANAALGLAHTLNRNPREGQLFLGLALSLAERHRLHREEILTFYYRAQTSVIEKEYDTALSDIDQALTLGQQYDIGEFETRLRYLKGQTYEEARRRAQALEAYEVAFNVARKSAYGRDEHLYQLASASAFRVNKTLPSASPYLTYVSGMLGLLLALSLLVYLAPRRRRAKTLPPRENTSAAPTSRFLPPGSSLRPDLSPTIARSIAYIWLLCFHLEHWRDAIHRLDPTLLDKLTAADPVSQQAHKPLLLAVYALEQELGTGDKDELKTPYRSIKIRLIRFFHEQGWLEIPKGVYGWRLFFLERGWETDPPLWLRQQLP